MSGFLDDEAPSEPDNTDDDPEEVELVEQSTVESEEDTVATPAPQNSLLTPVTNIGEVVELYDQFEEIKEELLDKEQDITVISGNPHVNKSGWRKIATAFNVSVEVTDTESWVEDEIVKAKAKAVATASNGKTASSTGMCASNESNHMTKLGNHPGIDDPDHPDVLRVDNKWRVLKDPKEVKEHNIVAIAETRAKNRAISDLVGGGEVSAEEMGAEMLDA